MIKNNNGVIIIINEKSFAKVETQIKKILFYIISLIIYVF